MTTSTCHLPLLSSSSSSAFTNPNSNFNLRPPLLPRTCLINKPKLRFLAMAVPQETSDVSSSSPKFTKLVTFLGKGGSGKTTSAIFAAQHYAMAGFNTCLVIHSQDPTAEYLLNRKLGTSPTRCNENLSAVRLETTKMLLEPLTRLKKADARLNMTQGVLEGIVGEELAVLPGMDSIFSAMALEKLIGFIGSVAQRNQQDKFDIIIYDGLSTEEVLRMIGAANKARLYLKYVRNMAEKTDFGRLAGPSILRLVDEAISLTGHGSNLIGKTSSDIWDTLDQTLQRGSSAIADPLKFGCYLVMNPENITSVNSALRYWGCAIQAGAHVSGAFGVPSPKLDLDSLETVNSNFSPLPFALLPSLSMGSSSPDWNTLSKDATNILSFGGSTMLPVIFDRAKKSVTLFMPGFDKSEIKLYQYRGGSELLVEAGDQRRVIHLPSGIQGKVGGAKFIERSLVITMR